MTVAADFLKLLRPAGPWVLTAILPDGPTETITASNEAEVDAFVDANNGKRNLYFSVNPTHWALTRKAAKSDIAAVEYLLADLDPRGGETAAAAKARYLAGLGALSITPTAVIDSGNGLQALWRLTVPVVLPKPAGGVDGEKLLTNEVAVLVADIEARSAALMKLLGSVAGTQNIDRILRLPGTTNLPNKKKAKEGRVKCQASLLKFNGKIHPLEAFPEPQAEEVEVGGASGSLGLVASLPVSERIKKLIQGIDTPGHPYGSRSERVMAVLVAMTARGCTDEQIVHVMTAEAIGAHVREQPKPAAYLAKQIDFARRATIDPHVAKLNEIFALVIIGDKVAVMKNTPEGMQFLTIGTFEQWHANQLIAHGEKNVTMAAHWLSHPQRRQYEGIVFAPGRDVPGWFNLWRGFAVKRGRKAGGGSCALFLTHLKDNVCCGDDVLYKWVVGWFAQIFQKPGLKMGTSLVLRGKQGVGKTKVGEVIGSLIGPHYVAVSDPRFVTGRFNSHLVSCLLLHADEGFWAGDHSAEGKLKDLITGNVHYIEYKGKEPIRVNNYVRLLVSGNPDWLVPAGFEERRFAVLEVGEAQLQNKVYFAAIDAEMDAGGREALLEHFMTFDLSTVDLRTIPTTMALLDQKLSSLDGERAWWLDVLTKGELPWGCEVPGECPAYRLFDRYIKHASRQGLRRRSIETKLGMFLTKQVPGLRRTLQTYSRWTNLGKVVGKVGKVLVFPPLAECRELFAKTTQQDIKWDEPLEWLVESAPDQEDRDTAHIEDGGDIPF